MTTNTKQFDDNMTGILGKNDYKQKDTHPDMRGRVKIHGVWFWVSGWARKSGQGSEFYSLAITEMTLDEAHKQEERSANRQRGQTNGGFGNTQQQQGQQQQGQQQQGQQQPQQPQSQQPQGAGFQPQNGIPANHPANVNNQPPADFDDDIPF